MPPEIRYVPQQTDADCGVATITMLAEITYECALRSLSEKAQGKVAAGIGINHFDLELALRKHGFVAFIAVHEHYAGGAGKRAIWPPEPMGWRHIVSSQNPDGTHHFSAMDWRGRVFDPASAAVRALSEFHLVNEVTIIVRPTAPYAEAFAA